MKLQSLVFSHHQKKIVHKIKVTNLWSFMEDFCKDNVYPQTLNHKNKVKQKNLKIQMLDFIWIL
jgi:hypothetical protein